VRPRPRSALARRVGDICFAQDGAVERLAMARLTTGVAILRTIWHMPPGSMLDEQAEVLDAAGQDPAALPLTPQQYEALRALAFLSVAAWTLGAEHPAVKATANASFFAVQRHLVAFHSELWSYTANLNLFLALLSSMDSRGSLAPPEADRPSAELASAAVAALQLYYAAMYTQSGISKVYASGWKWMDGRTIRASWAEMGTGLGKRLGRADRRVAMAASVGTVAFEVAFLPALLAGWRRRRLLGAAAIGFHGSVKATMDISFWHHAWYAVTLLLLPPDAERPIARALRLARGLVRRALPTTSNTRAATSRRYP
jgi:hypothetical protein